MTAIDAAGFDAERERIRTAYLKPADPFGEMCGTPVL